jgi:hypothetical protein
VVEESNVIRFRENLADLPIPIERDPDSHGHLDDMSGPVERKSLLAMSSSPSWE